MKIVTLISYKVFPPQMGGQKGIALFYKYLCRQTPVTMITIRDNDTGQLESLPAGLPVEGRQAGLNLLPVISNSRFRYMNPFLYFKVKRILKKQQATHFIIEHPYYGWLATLIKWFMTIKLVVHSHNIEYRRFRSTGKWWWWIMKWYERCVHRRADQSFFIQEEDRDFAIQHFKLDPSKCFVATYGTETASCPSGEERSKAKEVVCKKHSIPPNSKIFLFNGTLDYKPNTDALAVILNAINPILQKAKDLQYRIIICGKNLPPIFKELKANEAQNVLYAGLVDDIDPYFMAADIFLNPVTAGGGIKTKLVEAIGLGTTVVSSESGAGGVIKGACGEKLIIVPDHDWQAFAREIIAASEKFETTPDSFYEYYSWEKITNNFINYLNIIYL